MRVIEEALELRRAGKFQEALRLLEHLYSTLETAQRLERIACLNEQSQCLWRMSQLEKAEARACEALQLAEESPQDLQGQGHALNNLGVISYYRGELDRSEAYWKQSLAIKKQTGDLMDIADALHNLGIFYTYRGDFDRAEECYQQSLATFKEIGTPQDIADSLNNLGIVYQKRGDLERAEQYYQRCLLMRKKYSNPQGIAEVRYQLARVFLMRDSLESAMDEVDHLAQLAQSSKLPDVAVKHCLAIGFLKLKQYELTSALNYGSRAKEQAAAIPLFELLVDAMEFLLQVLLEFYLATKRSEYRTRIEATLEELEEVSKREQLHGTIIETILLKGFLKKAVFDLKGAVHQFELAEYMAEERGIRLLAQRARIELVALKDQTVMFQKLQDTSPRAYAQMQLENMANFIQSLTGPITFDPSQLFMLVIKYTERGPEVIISEKLPLSEEKSANIFAKASVFYSTAIGQGGAHYQGLYGPLPLTDSFSCLIYAQHLPDAERLDPRMPGKTYSLLCLGYPNGLDHFFADRDALSKTFDQWIKEIQDISEIRLELLEKIRNEIARSIQKQFIVTGSSKAKSKDSNIS